MAAEDWIDDWFPEDDERGVDITCKFCGKDGLLWDECRGVWRLYDLSTGEYHNCPERSRADASEFPVETVD